MPAPAPRYDPTTSRPPAGGIPSGASKILERARQSQIKNGKTNPRTSNRDIGDVKADDLDWEAMNKRLQDQVDPQMLNRGPETGPEPGEYPGERSSEYDGTREYEPERHSSTSTDFGPGQYDEQGRLTHEGQAQQTATKNPKGGIRGRVQGAKKQVEQTAKRVQKVQEGVQKTAKKAQEIKEKTKKAIQTAKKAKQVFDIAKNSKYFAWLLKILPFLKVILIIILIIIIILLLVMAVLAIINTITSLFNNLEEEGGGYGGAGGASFSGGSGDACGQPKVEEEDGFTRLAYAPYFSQLTSIPGPIGGGARWNSDLGDYSCGAASAVMAVESAIPGTFPKTKLDPKVSDPDYNLKAFMYLNDVYQEHFDENISQHFNGICGLGTGTSGGAFYITSDRKCNMSYAGGTQEFLNIFGLEFTNTGPSCAAAKEAIDAGYPILSGFPAHIIVIVGYRMTEGNGNCDLLVNDPAATLGSKKNVPDPYYAGNLAVYPMVNGGQWKTGADLKSFEEVNANNNSGEDWDMGGGTAVHYMRVVRPIDAESVNYTQCSSSSGSKSGGSSSDQPDEEEAANETDGGNADENTDDEEEQT